MAKKLMFGYEITNIRRLKDKTFNIKVSYTYKIIEDYSSSLLLVIVHNDLLENVLV